jgi:hypothetical protein
MNNLEITNIEINKTTLETQTMNIKTKEDILFIEYIQTQDDKDDEHNKIVKELLDSLDLLDSIDDKDIKQNKKIKSIKDIQDECEENNEHFHITKEQFDDIYDPQFAIYNDEYNNVCDNILILKRMIKRKMFVNIQDAMIGYSRARYINSFKLEKPEIELCDIINFIYKLKTIRPKYDSSVYIDLCQDSKFYVGISCSRYLDKNVEITDDNMSKCRLADHRNNGGTIMPTNFTHMYPVISTICCFFGDKEDEDLITILMTKCVGNNIRGGIYASPFNKLPDFSNITIDEIKNKLLNKILK